MSDKTSEKQDKKSAVIALGYFDAVHKGHERVLNLAKEISEKTGAIFVALSFKGNLRAFFKKDEKVVYTSSERKYLLKKHGIKEIFEVPVNKKFLSLTGERFLDFLSERYDVKYYVCGKDYVFGSDKKDVEFLKRYAENSGKNVLIAKECELNGVKISATAIKSFLAKGDVDSANEYLGQPYFITGKVFSDRHIGAKIGFPTVNIKIDKEKSPLFFGVYGGHVVLKGKKYEAVINYGGRPTFNLDEKLIEAHIVGYSGNLYGKRIRIFFDFFIRKIMSFSSEEELKERIKKDVIYLKERNR